MTRQACQNGLFHICKASRRDPINLETNIKTVDIPMCMPEAFEFFSPVESQKTDII